MMKSFKRINELLPKELDISEKNRKLYKELLEKQSAKNPGKTFLEYYHILGYNMKAYIFGLILLVISSILSISQTLVLNQL